MDQNLSQARLLLGGATHVVVLTGAGISTDSGIPDFRGPDGLWTKDPSAEALSTLEAYVADPAIRERSWESRLNSPARLAQPNEGHRLLLNLERRGVLSLLITQNIDGLHHAAGSDPDRIVEIHGNTRESVCLECGNRQDMERTLDRVRSGERDPHCQALRNGEPCGGILKSATISFGQGLIAADLARAEQAVRSCDLLLVVGSTLSVYPIAAVVPMAVETGAKVIIVNGQETALDAAADVLLRGDITKILGALLGEPSV